MIELIKCLHLLCILGLLGTLFYSMFLLFKHAHTRWLMKPLILLSTGALITGTLLVHPTHFTFHTPWIKAAYLLLGIFVIGITIMCFTKNKKVAYCLWVCMFILLALIIQDAVSKETFLRYFKTPCF